jgi:hypothetical protein
VKRRSAREGRSGNRQARDGVARTLPRAPAPRPVSESFATAEELRAMTGEELLAYVYGDVSRANPRADYAERRDD